MSENNWFVKHTPTDHELVPEGPIAYFLSGEALSKARGSLIMAKGEPNSPAIDALIDAIEALVDALQGMASPLPSVGDLVVLKSGGPKMRITFVDYFGVHVDWDDEGTLNSSFFPFDCVRKVV